MRKRHVGFSISPLGAAVLAIAALGVTGCAATTQTAAATGTVRVHGAVGYVTPNVPEDLQAYPHVRWHGRDAYFADGRWFYPSDQGWLVLEQVPPDLQRHEQRLYGQPQGYPGAGEGYGEYAPNAPPPPGAGYYGYQGPPSAPGNGFPTEIGGYPVEPAPAPPPPQDLSRARRAPFAGGQAYFVNGHWYYWTPAGWARFVTAPTELGRTRRPIQ